MVWTCVEGFVWYCRKARLPPVRYRQFRKPDGAGIVEAGICTSDEVVIRNHQGGQSAGVDHRGESHGPER